MLCASHATAWFLQMANHMNEWAGGSLELTEEELAAKVKKPAYNGTMDFTKARSFVVLPLSVVPRLSIDQWMHLLPRPGGAGRNHWVSNAFLRSLIHLVVCFAGADR